MNSIKILFSRKFYRSLLFWLIFLLSLYSGLGFLALPKLLYNSINQQVSQHLGWQTNINKITVNPFLFTLTIEQLLEEDNSGN